MSTDPQTHKRYLDYRERLVYFVKEGHKPLSYDQFALADAEHRALEAKGEARDEDDDARFVALAKALLSD